jgi:hypothetical protein
MFCQLTDFKRSNNLSQKRIERATNTLGKGVVYRLLAFASYLLGWSYEDVARSYGYSVPGLKSLVKQVFSKGLERFVDQRRKDVWLPPSVEPLPEKAEVHLEKRDDVIIVHMNATSLVIRAEDNLARKILAMILVDSGVMTQKAAAEITGTMPLAVSKNFQTFKTTGAVGLIDKREGQKQDYKFSPEVKGELIYGYSMKALENIRPTSSMLAQYLSNAFGQPFSRRSVSHHLEQIGLNLVGQRMVDDTQHFIQELRKKGLQNSN